MDWLEAVDAYLYELGRIGAEQVLCDGCLSGRVLPAVAGCCTIEPELIHRTMEDDGGTAEGYQGTLVVAGVRYVFECQLFADQDGSYFVSNIAHFEPVEWTAELRIA